MAGKITYIAPVDYGQGKIFGKKNKWTAVKRSFGNKQKGCSYGDGRNMVEHPFSAKEVARHNSFSTISKRVAARMDIMSSTYNQDMAAFMAQRDIPGGIRRFRPWLWADEKKKLASA